MFSNKIKEIKLILPPIIALSLLIYSLSGCAAEKAADNSARRLDTPKPRLNVRIDTEAISYSAMERSEFAAVVSGGDGDYSYIWDFNAADGYDVDGFQPVNHYIYSEPGLYTISLHVADSGGATGEATLDIDIGSRKYAAHKPIEIRDLKISPDRPYVIAGYDITNPQGNGITLQHCENIIIRNCYIHDCRTGNGQNGRAIQAEDCRNLTIQNVYVQNNARGILIEGYPNRLSGDILVQDNVVVGSEREDGISFRNVENVETSGNILYDNGSIWEARISGISFNGTFHNVKARHNLVVNSNSDGIECMGYDEQDIATNVHVYANVLRDNGEQGVWFFRIREGHIHHNYIKGSHNNGVCMDGWVSNVLVDHNVIIHCGGTPEMKHHGGGAVGIQSSPDNIIQSNICFDSSCGDVVISYHEKDEDRIKGMDCRFRQSAGNIVDSNVMCSSESNINIADGVSEPSITNNVVWQRGRSPHYHGCHPDESNVKAKPLFRAPERGDFWLLSNSPGYDAIRKSTAPQPAGRAD